MQRILVSLCLAILPGCGNDSGEVSTTTQTETLEVCGFPLDYYDLPRGAANVSALIEHLADGNSYVREKAIYRLRLVGPPASPAIPALARLLRDDCGGVSSQAGNALAAIGEASVPVLIEALTDELHWVRSESAYSLADIGPPAALATSALATALNDENSFVRYVSARALGLIGPAAVDALEALQAALDDEKENVRKAAAQSIAQITGSE